MAHACAHDCHVLRHLSSCRHIHDGGCVSSDPLLELPHPGSTNMSVRDNGGLQPAAAGGEWRFTMLSRGLRRVSRRGLVLVAIAGVATSPMPMAAAAAAPPPPPASPTDETAASNRRADGDRGTDAGVNGRRRTDDNSRTGANDNSRTGANDNSRTGANDNSRTGANDNSRTGANDNRAPARDDASVIRHRCPAIDDGHRDARRSHGRAVD